jgi:hypothetical protein
MVDHGRVRHLLDRLRLETDRLRRLADRPTEELLNDEITLGSAQFRFLLAIEAASTLDGTSSRRKGSPLPTLTPTFSRRSPTPE